MNVHDQVELIRALANELWHTPKEHFNMFCSGTCAIHVACTLPAFRKLGWRLNGAYPKLPKLPHMEIGNFSVKVAGMALGLQQWHVGFDDDGRAFPLTVTPQHVAITYLEYIGDCGPQLPSKHERLLASLDQAIDEYERYKRGPDVK